MGQQKTSSAHTPAPWSIHPVRVDTVHQHDSVVVHASSDNLDVIVSGDKSEANAQRIVDCVNACEGINPEAAPELLAALRIVRSPYKDGVSDKQYTESEIHRIVDTAIAKAEGRA